MTKITVRNCQNCGSDEISHGYSWPPMVGIVECSVCKRAAVADNESAAIEKWNRGETVQLVSEDEE